MVVWTFDPDVLNLPSLIRIRGAARAKVVFEQRFDLLQTAGFGFWQAAICEEETQQGHGGVQEESSWEDKAKEHAVTEDSHPQRWETQWHNFRVLIKWFACFHSLPEKETDGDNRSRGQLILDHDCPHTSRDVCGEEWKCFCNTAFKLLVLW